MNANEKTKYEKIGYRTVNAGLLLKLLEDIRILWDDEGFGSDADVSEPLYNRLSSAIEAMDDTID